MYMCIRSVLFYFYEFFDHRSLVPQALYLGRHINMCTCTGCHRMLT